MEITIPNFPTRSSFVHIALLVGGYQHQPQRIILMFSNHSKLYATGTDGQEDCPLSVQENNYDFNTQDEWSEERRTAHIVAQRVANFLNRNNVSVRAGAREDNRQPTDILSVRSNGGPTEHTNDI
jgi:hypothetical protein